MKKGLTLFGTMALCVTIGGVYATWTYAQSTATSLEDQEISTTITVGSKVSKGDIVLDTNTLELIVSNDGDYNTKLTLQGALTVHFAPTQNAEVKNAPSTINVQYQLTASNGWTFKDGDAAEQAIFNVPTAAVELGESNTWTIEASSLGITMPAFNLGTYEEYEAFKAALESGSLTITFSEVV